MVSSLVLSLCLMPQPQEPVPEDRYVEILDVAVPDGIVLEVGGLVERGDELFVCTRRGEIWRATGLGGSDPRWSLWAEGLQEPLGLIDHEGWLWCGQRGELSRMRDASGSGRMDELETWAQGWPLSGNYHEYCFGPALAPDGSFWLTLNKPFGDEPFGAADWRGWAIRIPPEGGSFEPRCAGLRSPAGVGTAPWGEIFYTDNQGEWCPVSKFAHLETGSFHGHPHGIDSCRLERSLVEYPGEVESGLSFAEAAARIPHFALPAVWIPYDLLGRSPTGFLWDTEGHFPPYRGQVFCGDQWSAEVFRMTLEKVGTAWQGACYPFRRGLKCGITRLLWSRDGSLWCGMTNRGWGSLGRSEYGLQRLRWRGGVPFEVAEIRAAPAGFRLRFTSPVDAASVRPEAFAVESWTYDLHRDYGCPPRDVRRHPVRSAVVSGEPTEVELALDDLGTVRLYEIRYEGVRSRNGATPWHDVAWYTLNHRPLR